MKYILFIFILSIFSHSNPKADLMEITNHQFLTEKLNKMTVREKIGQLFMVAAYSNRNSEYYTYLEKMVKDNHIGGLIFFQGNKYIQAGLSNRLQNASKIPLLMGMDAEWGTSMRLDDGYRIPYAGALGAITDEKTIFDAGRLVGEECKALGVRINFAPVADVNSNPLNPIIGFRSFGENSNKVANQSTAFFLGQKSAGILSCAKHFPGHGDTKKDSHKDLPVINQSKEELYQRELIPFQKAIKHGIESIMVAHIKVPKLDKKYPASISPKIVTGLLRNELKYKGLIVTDALNMKGVSKYYKPGYVDYLAFKAGNDVLLFSENVPKGIKMIENAIKIGDISIARLDSSVMRILRAKNKLNLFWKKLSNVSGHPDKKMSKNWDITNKNIAKSIITLAQDPYKTIPIYTNKKLNISHIYFGKKQAKLFSKLFSETFITNSINGNLKTSGEYKHTLARSDYIFVSIHDKKRYTGGKYHLTNKEKNWLYSLSQNKKVIILGFCSPYYFKDIQKNHTLILGYHDTKWLHHAALKALMGLEKINGVLPVSINSQLKVNTSLASQGFYNEVIEDCVSEELPPNNVDRIEQLTTEIVETKAAPGGQIVVFKNGKRVFSKNFGKIDYSYSSSDVSDFSVYDIASITKTVATTITIMKLQEEGKININHKLSTYLPILMGSNKEKITLKNILLHQAGLVSWIPFYKSTLKNRKMYYRKNESSGFTNRINGNLWLMDNYQDTIIKGIVDSEVKPNAQYKYSDLGLILLRFAIENITQTSLDNYVDSVFFKPMNLTSISYKPSEKWSKKRTPPAENDKEFRIGKVLCNVHDPACAMLNGVAGHAGVFSNALDIAVIYQMLLNNGTYKGKQYLKKKTIRYFTQTRSKISRRGIGFDKPPKDKKRSPAGDLSSHKTFGHTGFTGTCVWADPKHNLIYVFLSNRTYPDQSNWKLVRGNYRTRIHDEIYRGFELY